jgi:hypothetical protein
MNENINWWYVLIGAVFTFFAQAGAWAQHNLQFKYPDLGPNWWGWYVVALPLTWLFLNATKYTVEGFEGQIWANRFVGFSIGIIVYAVLTQTFFDQPITIKIAVQLLLASGIVLVQALWK